MLNLLIDNIDIYEKQIVNDWWIRKENLLLKQNNIKWRITWFYMSSDKEKNNVANIIEDRRKLYVELWANIEKWDIVKINWAEQYEVLNVYINKDSVWSKFKTVLIKTIK